MIGIVIVSHSAKLVEGVIELSSEMGGEDLQLYGAGGLNTATHSLGTDPAMIREAIEQAYSPEGVLVLMDLGSALLSAETAIDMLPPDKAEAVVLCHAPLVEGAVAAAVQARLGAPIEQVAAEAEGALAAKIAHLASATDDIPSPHPSAETPPDDQPYTLQLTIKNPLGLHARPAARFVKTAGDFPQATVYVSNETTGQGPVNAKSINGMALLGVQQGHAILIAASGPQAQAALEALQMLANDNFGDKPDIQPSAPSQQRPPSSSPVPASNSLQGVPVSPGIAIGVTQRFQPTLPTIPEHPTENPQSEWEAFLSGIEKARSQIQTDLATATRHTNDDTAAMFEAHLLFLDDEALRTPTYARIFNEKMNAAAAWMQTIQEVASKYRHLEDNYLRSRAKDVEDVGNLVLRTLLGVDALVPTFDHPAILIAPELTPAETTHLDPAYIQGILTAFGGPTSHASILARSLGIPAAAGLGQQILDVQDDTLLVMDGETGRVWLDPGDEIITTYTQKAKAAKAAQAQARKESQRPAITHDGHRVEVAANIRTASEAALAVDAGAESVGLFRTEFLFLDRDSAPDEQEQYEAYRTAAAGLDNRPLIIRTLDAGGDKYIPYLNLEKEANPFLGWRAIRVSLEHTDLFKTQLRAILKVAAEYPIKIMFPMITTLEEWHSAQALLDEATHEIRENGGATPDKIETGIMIEVPAAALMAAQFAEEVDFFSIGTNDLTQYTLAAERGNPKVAQLSDAYHPAILQLIHRVVKAAHTKGKWAGICGELASDPQAIPLLVGLGIDELSMSAPAIPRAKQIIRQLDYSEIRQRVQAILDLNTTEDVRAACKTLY